MEFLLGKREIIYICFNQIGSMHGIFTVFTYIWLILMENVGKYTIHAWRIIPFSKWLITMASFHPLNGIIPRINGLNGL